MTTHTLDLETRSGAVPRSHDARGSLLAPPAILRNPIAHSRRTRGADLPIVVLLAAMVVLLAVAAAAFEFAPPSPSAFDFIGP